MGFAFRLEDYESYRQRVGRATVLDMTRRTDPARIERVWQNLGALLDAYGSPWVAQIWTKDMRSTLERGGRLLAAMRNGGTTLTAQMTVTGLGGSIWEPSNGASPFAGAQGFFEQAGGPDHLTWRYDPIIPTVHVASRFARLADRAARLGISRCVINFVAAPGTYKRVDARLDEVLPGWADGMPGFDDDWRVETAAEIVEMARERGLRVAACAESGHLAKRVPGLRPAACGDRSWFERLSGQTHPPVAGSGSRRGCGCAPYFDVGLYGQWARCHRCAYCYAG